MTSQMAQVTFGSIQLAGLLSSLLTFCVLVSSAMALNPLAALLVVVVAAAIFGLLRPLSTLGHRRARQLSQAQVDFASGVGETVRTSAEVRVFGVGDAVRSRVAELADQVRGLVFSSQFIGQLIPGLFQGAIYLTVIGGLGLFYATDSGGVASLGAVVLLLIRAGSYGQQIQAFYQTVRQTLPFIERIQAAKARYEASSDACGNRSLDSIDRLSFAGVSFGYRRNRDVLSNISFEVERGETIGIVGPSGAGKSTLVQLLLNLRTPRDGRYTVNGVEVSQFRPRDWCREVAYLPQDPSLLHASVAENIRFYRDLDDSLVERAAKLARVHDDVVTWKDGYETLIGPRADSISGGQQQRICLARALAARPSMLVLDEPTSALDPTSERLIQDSLRYLATELTAFLVTHRMSALSICDRVMVVAGGRIEAFGSFEELRSRGGYLAAAIGVDETERQDVSGGSWDRDRAGSDRIRS
jgi:ABC-type multidrug transport system fused ATPase/permease subunit